MATIEEAGGDAREGEYRDRYGEARGDYRDRYSDPRGGYRDSYGDASEDERDRYGDARGEQRDRYGDARGEHSDGDNREREFRGRHGEAGDEEYMGEYMDRYGDAREEDPEYRYSDVRDLELREKEDARRPEGRAEKDGGRRDGAQDKRKDKTRHKGRGEDGRSRDEGDEDGSSDALADDPASRRDARQKGARNKGRSREQRTGQNGYNGDGSSDAQEEEGNNRRKDRKGERRNGAKGDDSRRTRKGGGGGTENKQGDDGQNEEDGEGGGDKDNGEGSNNKAKKKASDDSEHPRKDGRGARRGSRANAKSDSKQDDKLPKGQRDERDQEQNKQRNDSLHDDSGVELSNGTEQRPPREGDEAYIAVEVNDKKVVELNDANLGGQVAVGSEAGHSDYGTDSQNGGSIKDGEEDARTRAEAKGDLRKRRASLRAAREQEDAAVRLRAEGRSHEAGGGGRAKARGRGVAAEDTLTDDERFLSPRERQAQLRSKFESSAHRLTRSLSDSSIPQIETLERHHASEGHVRRANSFDITEYYPHRWYYARMARRKARMETLKASEKAGLDDGADDAKPSIEILSLNGGSAEATLAGLEGHSVSGPLASLQEGVIGGIEVDPGEIDMQTGKILASRPDHLTLTYEIDVAGGESLGDGGARRAAKVGGEAGRGRGAWVSDAEDGGLEELADAALEKESDPAEDADGRGVHRRKAKGSKLHKRKTQDKEQTVSNRLAEILQEKAEAEERRRDLFLKARELHEEIQRVREKRREKWWQQFSHERKLGTQLEERQGALRSELDSLHRRIIGSLVKRQPLVTGVRDEPSRKANYKISIIRLRHEIEDISRRVEAMNIKVEAETKLRSQAEREVKTLRSEVSRKKANVALSQTKTNLLKTANSLPPDLMIRMY
nr:uncharacterized protein LOC113814002 [Penaeus vannamei]